MDYEKRLGAAGKQLREYISQKTATAAQDWFFTFRAREALQVVCRQLYEAKGLGEVLTQLLTCSTVPEGIMAGGLKPRYLDIDEDTLAVRPELVTGENVRALIYQHSYGMFDAASAKALKEALRGTVGGVSANVTCSALFIEDCAHCALAMEKDWEDRPVADVSLHSFGVEKMIKTTFGAAVWVNPDMEDKALRERIVSAFEALPDLDPATAASVKSYRNRFRVLSHLPMRLRKPLRAKWVAKHKFIPAVAEDELAGKTILEPSLPTDEVLARVLEKLKGLDENEAQRKAAVLAYLDALLPRAAEFEGAKDGSPEAEGSNEAAAEAKDSNAASPINDERCGKGGQSAACTEPLWTIPAAARKARPLLWLPVVVDSPGRAERICRALNAKGFYSSRWGRPLLFPGVTKHAMFCAEGADASCPGAVHVSQNLVLLPTNRKPAEVEQILGIFKDIMAEDARPQDSFAAVLLGTETSVYNMARAFYEAYGIKSNAYGQKPLQQTANSKFVTVRCNKDFAEPEGFVRVLNSEAWRYRGRIALLLSCGDSYTKLLSACRDRLDPVYLPVCPDEDVAYAVNFKAKFYEICEQAGVPYPKTVRLTGPQLPEEDLGYPAVLKPDDADNYRDHPFEGQKKAFILKDRAALEKALADTYAAGYEGIMLLQEFIPGGDENMRVVNGYKRSDGKLALMAMGQPLLEDYSPMAIGNYMVILAHGNDQVYDTVEKLLEHIPYLGYFNLDLKYDSRDGLYKVFDFNPRMGRSSYYVTLAGNNLAECVVDDYVRNCPAVTKRAHEETVWADVPNSIVKKYVNDGPDKEKALQLMAEGKCGGTFKNSGDDNWKRRIRQLKTDLRNIRNYKRYFVKK